MAYCFLHEWAKREQTRHEQTRPERAHANVGKGNAVCTARQGLFKALLLARSRILLRYYLWSPVRSVCATFTISQFMAFLCLTQLGPVMHKHCLSARGSLLHYITCAWHGNSPRAYPSSTCAKLKQAESDITLKECKHAKGKAAINIPPGALSEMRTVFPTLRYLAYLCKICYIRSMQLVCLLHSCYILETTTVVNCVLLRM